MQPLSLRPLVATVAAAILATFAAPDAHADGEGAVADALARKITEAFSPAKDLPPPPIPFAGTKGFDPEKRRADDPIIGLWSFRHSPSSMYGPMAILPNGMIGTDGAARVGGGILWYPTPKPGFYTFRIRDDNDESTYALIYLNEKEQKLIYLVGSDGDYGEKASVIEGFLALMDSGIPVATIGKHMSLIDSGTEKKQFSAKRVTPPLCLKSKVAPEKGGKSATAKEKVASASEPPLPDFLIGIWEGKYKEEDSEPQINIRMILTDDTADYLLRCYPVEKKGIERKKTGISLKPTVSPNLFFLSADYLADARYFVYFAPNSNKENGVLLRELDFYGEEYLPDKTIAKLFKIGYSLDEICAHLNLQKIPITKVPPAAKKKAK